MNDHNLKPIQKGEVRNPKGKAKGVRNWGTIVRRLLADDTTLRIIEDNAPRWVKNLEKKQKNAANAIVIAMQIQAMKGDTKAAEWLRKTGFGDKLDITSKNKKVRAIAIFDLKERPDADDDRTSIKP